MKLDAHTLLLIDGNNLWHAVQASDLGRAVGRHRLVELVNQSVSAAGASAVVVFDGGRPRDAFARQMQTPRVQSLFSGPRTADEVLLEWLDRRRPGLQVVVVTDDKAVAHGARARRASVVGCAEYIATLIQTGPVRRGPEPPLDRQIEPASEPLDAAAVDEWLRRFGCGDEDLQKPYWQDD